MMYGFNQGIFGLAALICAGLYGVKHEARVTEKDLGRLAVDIEEEREQLRMLQAEWALRTEPERLQQLADRHLEIAPVAPRQILALPTLSPDALPPLDPREMNRPVSAAPRLAERSEGTASGRRIVFSLDTGAQGQRFAQNTDGSAASDGRASDAGMGLKASSRLAGAGLREDPWRAP